MSASAIVAGVVATALLLAACGSSSSSNNSSAAGATSSAAGATSSAASGSSSKPIKIAYLSFAVTNSYDAPMLAAAKAVAAANNATLTVFDANNSPAKQYSQFQDAITSGGYQGIITQPIISTNLIPLVKQAVSKGIKVVNMDQTLGTKLNTFQKQVPGLSGQASFDPTQLGTLFGKLVVQACKAKNLNPCNIGYMYDIKASALDVAIRSAFNKAIASDPSAHVVAQGQDFFTPSMGLKAAQDMLASNSSINLIAASDQGIEGAQQAVSGKNVTLVGFGASAAGLKGVASGAWYGTVVQAPATEGRIATQQIIAAVRSGKDSPAVNPLSGFPNNGVVTKSNVSQFHAEWPG